MTYDYDYAVRWHVSKPPYRKRPKMVNLSFHTFVIGKTGSGKTNYLKQILDALEEKSCNIVLLDPHGRLADYALSKSGKRKLLLSGLDYEGSDHMYAGINALAAEGMIEASLVSDWLSRAFSTEETLSYGTWGPRLEFIFSVLLPKYIIGNSGATLKDFVNFLNNREVLTSFCESAEETSVFQFLVPYLKNSRMYTELISSTMNKLAPITETPVIRRVLSVEKEKSVDLDNFIHAGNSLIVPEINRGSVGASAARAIATLFLSQVWTSLQRQGTTTKRTYLIIDEAQDIPAEVLKDILSQGRKFGIVTVLASQTMQGYLRKHVPDIISNIRNWVCFQIAEEDADIISRNIEPTEENGTRLRQAYIMQSINNATISTYLDDGTRYGPVTVTPDYSGDDFDSHMIEEEKAELIRKYGYAESAPLTPELTPEDYHEKMIFAFTRILEREVIEYTRETGPGNLRADIQFKVGSKEFFCEVEYSDLARTMVIAKKLYDYRDHNLVFICLYEHFDKLISAFRRINDRIRSTMAMYQVGPEKVPALYAIKSMLATHLLVYREGSFYFYDGAEFEEFWMGNLLEESSFRMRARSLPVGDVRVALLDTVLSLTGKKKEITEKSLSRVFGVKRTRMMLESIIDRGYAEVNLNSMIEFDRILMKY